MFESWMVLLAPQAVALSLNLAEILNLWRAQNCTLTLHLTFEGVGNATPIERETTSPNLLSIIAQDPVLTQNEPSDKPQPTDFAASVVPTRAAEPTFLTINVINRMSVPLSVSHQSATFFDPTQTVVAPQLVNITASTGVFSEHTQIVVPSGWAGRMTLGKAVGPLDPRGTKIEGNFGFKGANKDASSDPDIDVSIVDGYSVPVTCNSGLNFISGCNKELFDLGNQCTNLVGDTDARVCVNEPRNIHGPAMPFFRPCQGRSYTYDFDDGANSQWHNGINVVTCCVGTDCPVGRYNISNENIPSVR